MNFEGLTKGENFIVEWQYRMLGDFGTALANAIMLADIHNKAKLAKGFPDEVEAYNKYSTENGWWQKLQKKIGR